MENVKIELKSATIECPIIIESTFNCHAKNCKSKYCIMKGGKEDPVTEARMINNLLTIYCYTGAFRKEK